MRVVRNYTDWLLSFEVTNFCQIHYLAHVDGHLGTYVSSHVTKFVWHFTMQHFISCRPVMPAELTSMSCAWPAKTPWHLPFPLSCGPPRNAGHQQKCKNCKYWKLSTSSIILTGLCHFVLYCIMRCCVMSFIFNFSFYIFSHYELRMPIFY